MTKNEKEQKAAEKETRVTPEEKPGAKPQEDEKIDYKDKWLRAMAEYDNLKKRFAKERGDFIRFANEQFFLQLIPIIDNFDRAHEAAKNHKENEMVSKGVEMILGELHKLLTDNGVEKIKTAGEKFDPHFHEAVGIVEDSEHPEDVVAEEISPGYTMSGKLLRAAKVKISSKKEEKGPSSSHF